MTSEIEIEYMDGRNDRYYLEKGDTIYARDGYLRIIFNSINPHTDEKTPMADTLPTCNIRKIRAIDDQKPG